MPFSGLVEKTPAGDLYSKPSSPGECREQGTGWGMRAAGVWGEQDTDYSCPPSSASRSPPFIYLSLPFKGFGILGAFLFIYALIHSLTHSSTHSFFHLFIHSFIHSFTHTFIPSLIQSFTYSFIHPLIYSLTHLFLHSFILSFIYVLFPAEPPAFTPTLSYFACLPRLF